MKSIMSKRCSSPKIINRLVFDKGIVIRLFFWLLVGGVMLMTVAWPDSAVFSVIFLNKHNLADD